MRFFSFVLISFTLFLFACGGNRTASSGSISDDTLEANAVNTSPWSTEPVVTATTSQKTSANINIQDLLTTVVSEDEDSNKKSKTRTVNINKVITGSKGGTATISGSRVITTTPPGVFPRTVETEGTIVFDGYEGDEFSLHGTSEYSGTKTITSVGNFTRTFTSHGGYSYKSNEGVVSFTTQMDVSITCVDGLRSGTFTFTVNGEPITGSLPIRSIDLVEASNSSSTVGISTEDVTNATTVSSLSASQKTADTANIQSLISSIISEEDSSSKKDRTRTVTINRDVVGPSGGSATVTGTRVVTTTPVDVYPITTATEANIDFDGYVGSNFTLAGETQYSGSTTITSARNFQTVFTTNGSFTYTDANGATSFTTQMNVTLSGADGVFSGSFTYVVNGQTITGSF